MMNMDLAFQDFTLYTAAWHWKDAGRMRFGGGNKMHCRVKLGIDNYIPTAI